MAFTGFRIVSPVAKIFPSMRSAVRAQAFEPDVLQFLKRSLTTAIQLTPARNLSLIKKAQRKQYSNRVNYIPSVHELIDPTLIVSPETGVSWLYCGGKWYAPEAWLLKPDIWQVYQELLHERERRLEITEEDFITERAQARFLYKRSWYEVGQSVRLDIACPQAVRDSHSRRTPSQTRTSYPAKPPRGYAQKRGGKGIYSVVVYNPFLDRQTRYWPGNGKQILATAMQKWKGDFDEKVAKRQTQIIIDVLKNLL